MPRVSFLTPACLGCAAVLALPDRGSLQLETGRSGHGSGLLSSPTAAKVREASCG